MNLSYSKKLTKLASSDDGGTFNTLPHLPNISTKDANNLKKEHFEIKLPSISAHDNNSGTHTGRSNVVICNNVMQVKEKDQQKVMSSDVKYHGDATLHLTRKHRSKTRVLEKPIEKLRRFLRSIRVIVRVCLALKGYTKKKKEEPTLREMQMKLEEDMNKRLTFNPHYYHASYVANKGSSKLKKLLAISPSLRTKKHVKLIHTLVQNKRAFYKYPAQIRLKICQVIIHQNYESRRVVIKQGHPPSAFYIILSGTCLINAKETDSDGFETNQTVNELQEGEVFGEVALLNNSKRTASVVCKSDVELLVIYKDDFDAIVRGPLYRKREGVVQFCKTIPVLSDWPVKLLSNSSVVNFYYQYYRKDAVVIKNSLISNFLVFVKSGECRVVCTLNSDEDNKKQEKPRYSHVVVQSMLPLLHPVNTEQSNKIRGRPSVATFPLFNQRLPVKRPILTLPTIVDGEEQKTSGGRKNYTNVFQSNNVTRRGVVGMQPIREKEALSNLLDLKQKQENHRLGVPRRSIRRSVIEDTPYAVAKSERLTLRKKKPDSLLDMNEVVKETFSAVEPTPRPKFAQIAMLDAGCSFGLEEMMGRTKLRLSLVSDGAECIFISRRLFLKHAGPTTLRCLHSMIGKYPTEEYIRHQLDKQAIWKQFRDDVMKDVLERRDERIGIPSFLKAI